MGTQLELKREGMGLDGLGALLFSAVARGQAPERLGGRCSFSVPVCLSDCKLIPSLPLCLNHKQDWAHGVCPCTYLWHICPDAQDSRVGKTIRKAVVNTQASVTRAAEELGQVPEVRTRTPSHLSVGFKD